LIAGPCETVKFAIVKVCCRVEICRLGADSSSSVTITGTPALDVEVMAQFVCVQSVEFPMREGGSCSSHSMIFCLLDDPVACKYLFGA
jgi:hypothetical protein